VYGLLKTAEVASSTPAANIALTLAAYVSVYIALIVAYITVLRYMAEHPMEAAQQPTLQEAAHERA
jgi:cytochrome d ubiquinol oxidase subunit I